jgi:predicted flavoprotein YhiN
MLTSSGIEGGPVYAVGRSLREALDAGGSATLHVDLRPDLDAGELGMRVEHRRRPKDSVSSTLRRTAGLSPAAIAVLREAGPLPTSGRELARRIKDVRLPVVAAQPIDRAISSAGGIALHEIDERFMLRRRPGTFVAGEMLDWEAPTGGYLLQATFSTAVAAARGVLSWLSSL